MSVFQLFSFCPSRFQLFSFSAFQLFPYGLPALRSGLALVHADQPPARGVVGEPAIRLRLGGAVPVRLSHLEKSRKQKAESRKRRRGDGGEGAVIGDRWAGISHQGAVIGGR